MGTEALPLVGQVALECLLGDQIRDRGAQERDYGSWGLTTLDYCFLSTMEPTWRPGTGSITQTAWALLALRDLDPAVRNRHDGFERAVNAASQYVTRYVDHFAQCPDDDRSKHARYRHSATALLCELLLEELSEDSDELPPGPEFFARYARLLDELDTFLSSEADRTRNKPTDLSLLALYPLVIARLMRARPPGRTNKRPRLYALLTAWRETSATLVDSAVRLLGRYDPRATPEVSKAHVWAAFLDVTSMLGELDGNIATVARRLYKEVSDESRAKLGEIRLDQLPAYSAGAFWEPWGVLALLVQLGADLTDSAAEVASGLIHGISTPNANLAVPIPGGCTHLWSILVRHLPQSLDTRTGGFPSEATRSVFGALRTAGQFDYRHWPRNSKTEHALTVRALQMARAAIRSDGQPDNVATKRFSEMYRGNVVTPTRPLVRRSVAPRTLLLAGYTRAGKSTAADFLERRLCIGRTVKRLTTADWQPGEDWEKNHYSPVNEQDFAAAQNVFGKHVLLDAKFAFDRRSFFEVPEDEFRLLPVGWVWEDIRSITEFCTGQGDHSAILVFDPSLDQLARRIPQKWGQQPDIEASPQDAVRFYSEVPSDAIVFDSSGEKEDLWRQLFEWLAPFLVGNRGWDVVISYAGPQQELAEDVRTALERQNAKAYVAGVDGVPASQARMQAGIAQVFSGVDLLLVLWSKDYPTRQFSSEEWIHWLDPMVAKDGRRVLLVAVDDTPLPPNVRESYHFRRHPVLANEIASAAIERLGSV